MKKISIALFFLLGLGLWGAVYATILPLEQVSGYYLRDIEGDNAALQGSHIALGLENKSFGVLSDIINGKVENRYVQHSLFTEEDPRDFDLSVNLGASLRADSDVKITVNPSEDKQSNMEGVDIKVQYTNATVQLEANSLFRGDNHRINREGFLQIDTGLTLKNGTSESSMSWDADQIQNPEAEEYHKADIGRAISYINGLSSRTNWETATQGATIDGIDYITPLGNLGNMTGKTAIYRIDEFSLGFREELPLKTVDGYPLVQRSELGKATAIAELEITDKSAYAYALFPHGKNLVLVISLEGELYFQLYSTQGELLDTLGVETYFKNMAALGEGTGRSTQNQEGVVEITFLGENKDTKQRETQVLLLDSSGEQLKPLFYTTLVGQDITSLLLEDRVIFGIFREGTEIVDSNGINRATPSSFYIEVYGLDGALRYHGKMETDGAEAYRRFLNGAGDYRNIRWPTVFKMEVYHAVT